MLTPRVALAVSLGSFAAAQQCTQYQYSDTFAGGKLDPNLWFIGAGPVGNINQAAGASSGIDINLDSTTHNMVVQSTLRFGPGSHFKIVAKGSDAPGVISTACLYDSAGGMDEIDLELVAITPNRLMVPAWVKAARLPLINPPKNNDWSSYEDLTGGATIDIEGGFQPDSAYTIVKNGLNWQTGYNTFEIDWQATVITYSLNGVPVLTYTEGSNGKFPSDMVPFNLGIWGSPGDASFASWAGMLDFGKTPKPTWSIQSVEITGCGIPNEYAPAGAIPPTVGAPPPASTSSTIVVTVSPTGSASASAAASVTTSVVDIPISGPASVGDATSTILPPLVAQPTQPAGGQTQDETTTPPLSLNQGTSTAVVVVTGTDGVATDVGVTATATDDGSAADASGFVSVVATSTQVVASGGATKPSQSLTPIADSGASVKQASLAGLAMVFAAALAL